MTSKLWFCEAPGVLPSQHMPAAPTALKCLGMAFQDVLMRNLSLQSRWFHFKWAFIAKRNRTLKTRNLGCLFLRLLHLKQSSLPQFKIKYTIRRTIVLDLAEDHFHRWCGLSLDAEGKYVCMVRPCFWWELRVRKTIKCLMKPGVREDEWWDLRAELQSQ